MGEAPGGATLVLYQGGVAGNIGAPAGAVEVRASAMSDGGHIVGTYRTTAGGPLVGFVWTAADGFVSLGAGVQPRDVNSGGVVVGGMTAGTGPRRPFAWSAAEGFRDLGVLKGDRGGEAWGINDLGDVAGESTARDGSTRATVWMEGVEARELEIPHPSTARDIDERRNILAGSAAWGVVLWTMDAGVASVWPTGDGNVYTPVRLTESGRVLGTYAGSGGPAATLWTLGMQPADPAQDPATVTGLAHQIRVLVVQGRLDPRRGEALLDRVISLFERGAAQADNRIGAFIRTVQGYVRQGYLTPADGDMLITYAQRLLPS